MKLKYYPLIFLINILHLHGQDSVSELPERSVTATKFEEPTTDLASSIHIINEEDLQKSGSHFILDALRKVPGVLAFPQGGMHGNHSIRLRGLPVEHNVILIDGVEMNNSASLGTSFDFGNLTASGIERVEIFNGPQSSMYGADAIGGVINVITRKGGEDSVNNFSVSGGSFNTYSTNFNFGTRRGNWSYNVSAQHYQTDGISSASVGTEKDGYKLNAGNFWLQWKKFEIFSIEAQVRVARNTGEFDGYDLNGNAVDDPDNVEKDSTLIYRIQPSAKFLDGKWESVLPVSVSFTENETVDDYSVPRELENTQPKVAWINRYTFDEKRKFTLGVEHESEEASIENFSVFTGQEPEVEETLETQSIYGLLQYSPFESLNLELSGRSDFTDSFGNEDTYRGSAAWRIAPETTLRTAYGTGFNTPTIALLYSYWGNPDLQAETSKSYEFGLDHHIAAFQTEFSLTWFHNDVTNLITWDNTAFRYENFDSITTRGLELLASWSPMEWLSVDASYTYTKSLNETTRFELGRTPKHVFSGTLSGSFINDKLNLNLESIHYGERFDGNSNNHLMPSHTVWNLSGTYFVKEDMIIHARVDNLFDKEYQYVLGYNTSPLAAYVGANFFF
jgi:vitamin B12 transporter